MAGHHRGQELAGIELRDGRPAERHIHNHADLVGALLHRQGLAKRVGEGRVLGRDGREDQAPSQGCDGRLFTANGVRAHVVHGAGHLLPDDVEDVLEAQSVGLVATLPTAEQVAQ